MRGDSPDTPACGGSRGGAAVKVEAAQVGAAGTDMAQAYFHGVADDSQPSNMQIALPQSADHWLLGTEPRQRIRMRRTLVAAGVYLLAAVGQWWSAEIGLADRGLAHMLILCLSPGLFGFYLLMRSGWNQRRADPALTMPQMVFAIVAMAAAYVINPPVRGMLLMIVALVLVFAAFTLSPQASRLLGGFAVVVLGLVMLAMATHAPQVFDPIVERIHFAFAAVVLPVISMLAGDLSTMRTRLKVQRTELQDALARIHKLATRDDLTGLINRRHMEELAEMEQRRAQRGSGAPCLCLVDIDHFKRINDQHGHAAGDEVLRLFARHAAASMRETDLLARWGGEEFLVMLPDTRMHEARTGFERLRRLLSRDEAWGERAHMRITFSAGMTAWRPDEALRDALARADTALYEAKASGRDRLVEK
jgi:diguanylate cyclase